MIDREEREKVIEILQKEKKTALHDNRWAFDYAISSIETDIKYDLLYEGVDCNNCKNNLHRGDGSTYCATGDGICHYECEDPTLKNDLVVDAVSRQAINGYIDYILSHGMGKKKSFDFFKKFVANLPSVTPQEPIIDRVRADVEPTRKMYLEMNDIDWLNGCDYVLSILDKYKAETEG